MDVLIQRAEKEIEKILIFVALSTFVNLLEMRIEFDKIKGGRSKSSL